MLLSASVRSCSFFVVLFSKSETLTLDRNSFNDPPNRGVAKGFCVTRDGPKISSVMRDGAKLSRVMRDFLFYKRVTRDLPIRFP